MGKIQVLWFFFRGRLKQRLYNLPNLSHLKKNLAGMNGWEDIRPAKHLPGGLSPWGSEGYGSPRMSRIFRS